MRLKVLSERSMQLQSQKIYIMNAANLQAIENGTEIVSSLLTKSTNNKHPGPTTYTLVKKKVTLAHIVWKQTV